MRRSNERGFALLLVFALAAAIAISFYLALPRTTFESQRTKEQVLIDRGQQYVIAIRRFYRQFQRFPTTIEDLESTNNMRFLRKRYKDPMTGKAEWRLIHAGPGGVLIDSINQKAGLPGQNSGQPGAPGQNGGFGQNQTADNSAQPDGMPEVLNPGLQRRPSDRVPGAPLPGQNANLSANPGDIDPNQSFPQPQPLPGVDPATLSSVPPAGLNQPGLNQPGGPMSNNQPGAYPPGIYPTGAGQPGTNQPGINQPGMGQPGVYPPGVYPPGVGQPGMNQPGSNQLGPNQPVVNQPGQYPPGTYPPGVNQPFPPGGATPVPSASNPALGQVQNQVFGPSAQTPANNSPFSGGQTVGGGLVGVASKVTERGIKQINKKRKYSEWEFYLDLKKQNGMSTGGPIQGGPQMPAQPNGTPGATTPQTNPGGPQQPPQR